MIGWVRRRLQSGRARTVTVGGHAISVPPNVLDPVLFRSGAWFATEAAAHISGAGPKLRVLDLGCGTGVVGVLASAAGASVVACDVDPAACAAARDNGLRDVRRGDLFRPVAGERFDLVLFNPPYLRGLPGGRLMGRAMYGGEDFEVIRRFSAALSIHLKPTGRAWVVLSDRGIGCASALGRGWRAVSFAHEKDETLTIWEWRQEPS